MRLGTAEALHVHVFAGDAAHHVGTGHEDAALVGEDHQVGQRGPVGGTAGGGAEHHRDLRNLARRVGHGREHHADSVQALDALEDPGAAGVPQAQDRRAELDRVIVSGDDRLASGDAHGAALHPRVAGERHGWHVADAASAGQDAAVVGGQQEFEGAFVEQRLKPGLRIALRPRRRRGSHIRRPSVPGLFARERRGGGSTGRLRAVGGGESLGCCR